MDEVNWKQVENGWPPQMVKASQMRRLLKDAVETLGGAFLAHEKVDEAFLGSEAELVDWVKLNKFRVVGDSFGDLLIFAKEED